jgi:hypothetical protein
VKPIVFLGPSLSAKEAMGTLDAIYLPPVAQGDVYLAARGRPSVIGIIDGYFERLPAVWHKEILWALSRGIHVFGGGSMGALRAAELAGFGMHGVGSIFEAFRDGALEDDDEVAVAHGDFDSGYRATSDAMVNIRATLGAAESSGVIRHETRTLLEGLAKELFYPDRSYARLMECAAGVISTEEMMALRGYLPTGRIDQKRADARAVLHAIRRCAEAGLEPEPVTFPFEHTEAWEQVVDWAEGQGSLASGAHALVAAEVRLSGADGRRTMSGALNRALASALARRTAVTNRQERVTRLERDDAVLRAARPAQGGADAGDGLEHPDLGPEEYTRLVQRQVDFDWARERYSSELDAYAVDELRLSGQYERLARRGLAKDMLLAASGLSEPTLKDAGLTETELLIWYLARIGRPDTVDIDRLLAQLGVGTLSTLRHEALREFLFSRLTGDSQGK